MPVSQYASTRAIHELGGFATVIALIVMFAAAKVVLYDTMDPDFFWHLRVAQQLHREGIGPIVDELSFASVKAPWTPYSWMGELGMKWIWDHAGLRGAIVTQAALESLFIVLVLLCAMQTALYVAAKREDSVDLDDGTSLLSLVVATALSCFLALPYLSLRPVLAAIVLLATCSLLLIRDRRLSEQTRLVWLVPVLTAIAINVHIFAIFVPMWVGALMVGSWIERDRDKMKRYSILLSLCLLACCCTPMLRGTFATIRYYATTDPLVSHSMIAEFEPMYRGVLHQATLGIVALFIVMAIARRQVRAGEMLWLGGMLVLWIRCGRAAPIFVPIFATVMTRGLPRFSDRALGAKWVSICGTCAIVVGAVRMILALPDNSNVDSWLNRHGPDLPGYPSAAAEYVDTRVHRSTGRLINEFDWGGYLAWKLPEYQVFVDGRTQLYTPQFWHAAYLDEPRKTTQLLATIRADAAILPAAKSRFRNSLKQLGWKCAFHDARAEVFVPPSSIAKTEEN